MEEGQIYTIGRLEANQPLDTETEFQVPPRFSPLSMEIRQDSVLFVLSYEMLERSIKIKAHFTREDQEGFRLSIIFEDSENQVEFTPSESFIILTLLASIRVEKRHLENLMMDASLSSTLVVAELIEIFRPISCDEEILGVRNLLFGKLALQLFEDSNTTTQLKRLIRAHVFSIREKLSIFDLNISNYDSFLCILPLYSPFTLVWLRIPNEMELILDTTNDSGRLALYLSVRSIVVVNEAGNGVRPILTPSELFLFQYFISYGTIKWGQLKDEFSYGFVGFRKNICKINQVIRCLGWVIKSTERSKIYALRKIKF